MFFVEAVFFWLVRDLRQEEGPLADNVLEQGWTEGAASRREVGAVGSFAQRDFAGKYCRRLETATRKRTAMREVVSAKAARLVMLTSEFVADSVYA